MGKGNIARSEAITISLAAVVLQTLPNGNLAIAGRQEVRVNSELRELQVGFGNEGGDAIDVGSDLIDGRHALAIADRSPSVN